MSNIELPLLADHHSHPLLYAAFQTAVDLSEVGELDQALQMLRQAAVPEQPIIVGHGWKDNRFAIPHEKLAGLPAVAVFNLSLHNLVINDTKINKVIFGQGIGILLMLYLFVLIPLYKRKPGVKSFVDKLAIPVAQNYQIYAYLLLLLFVQVIMASSKKGEMLELAGSVIFLLNVMYPYNRSNFLPLAAKK